MKIFITLLLLAICQVNLHAQSLITFGVNSDKLPRIKTYFYAKDAQGNLLTNLTPATMTVTENGIPRKIVSISCPPAVVPAKISSVLTIDISGSMAHGTPSINMDIAKAAGRKWISLLPDDSSECALTSFDCDSYLNQDFTTDKSRLNGLLNSLKPNGCTNYDAAFIYGAGAALAVAKRAKFKKVIVFLTDGKGSGDIQLIQQQAQAINAEIYCVGVNLALSEQIKYLAEQTHGAWFENISTPEKIEEIYERIFELARSSPPCELVWETDIACLTERTATISVNSPILQSTVEYSVSEIKLPKVTFSPSSVKFTNISPGNSDTRDITITAETDSIIISSIICPEPSFTIENGPSPIWKLNKGDTKTFTVRFVPTDSSLAFTKIQVQGNFCNDALFYAMGGYTKSKKPMAQLKVIAPNGGEKFPSGDTTTLRWTGVLPSDTVKLDYSTDSGITWLPIAARATGLSYLWTVPPTPSNRCRFRVQQYEKRIADSLLFLKGHTKAVNEACFSPNSERAVTVSGDRTFIIWNTISGLAEGSPQLIHDNTAGFCVDWSTDASQIVIGGNAGGGLYDAASLAYLYAVSPPSATYSCAFSKDSKYVLTTGGPALNSIFIWSEKDKLTRNFPLVKSEYLTRITVGRSNTTHITALTASNDTNARRTEIDIDTSDFGVNLSTKIDVSSYSNCVAYVANPSNPDTMCAAFENGQLRIYPSSPPIILRLFEGDPINDMDWSPDGKLIAVALKSGRLAIVDLAAQKIARRLDTVKAEAFSIRWDIYSSKVIASYANNLALIWQVGDKIEQQDVSDSLWEITTSSITIAKDVDFGRVAITSSRDTVVQSLICITQNALSSSRIDSAVILNDPDGVFRIISGVPAIFPKVLPACLTVELGFSPKKIGFAVSTLRLYSNSQFFDITMVGIGFDIALSYPELLIDFGKIPVGSFKDSLISPSITNLSKQTLNITHTTIAGPDIEQFFIINGDTTILLNYQDIGKLQLRFAPLYSGRTSSRVRIEFTRQGQTVAGSPVYITLFGEGICGSNEKRIMNVGLGAEIPTVVGSIVQVPIVMKLPLGQSRNDISTRFFCLFSFDATMLMPLEPLPTGKIVGNRRIVTLEAERLHDSDTLLLLPLLTMLGNDSIADIHIDSLYFDDGGCKFTFETDSVRVKLTDLCTAGGSTRLLAGSPTTRIALLPNPTSEKATILLTLAEDSPITLSIHNTLGQEILVQRDNLGRGSHERSFDCTTLPTGIYSLMLSTRSEVKFLQFVKQ